MRKITKAILISIAAIFGIPLALVVIVLAVGAYLYLTADFLQPNVGVDLNKYELSIQGDSLRVCEQSSLLLNKYGLWEAHISGGPIERGAKYGILCKDLLKTQEDAFVDQIHEIIPSDFWVECLHKFIIIFNRSMAHYIPKEYREEIYAISLSCTDEYNAYGAPYVRQLNYHAAHDIGHTMQEYMLVGCSSFACWANESENNNLIIGRNFDFYVGDDFAKNKIILFVEPDNGYKFASISWPGMMGVLSGMNEKGLTVTINASKGQIPTSSAIPISLLTRHILQYASNISEAYELAKEFDTFVSESILVGSAHDRCAAIIEKTPNQIALYKSDTSSIVCTNHYQSPLFANDKYNMENIASTDSPYRHHRINDLLDVNVPLSTNEAVDILRNRYGLNNADIGLSNEKSINQFIAHHSVVFEPAELRFWVSTSPWQLGEYVCYDLNDIFDAQNRNVGLYILSDYNIPTDSIAINDEYLRVCRYREQYKTIMSAIDNNQLISPEYKEEFLATNPNYFQVYNALGDYEESVGNYIQAISYWQKALTLEIAREAEKIEIISKIKNYD